MDVATKFHGFTEAGAPGNWSAIDPRRATYLDLLGLAQGLYRENKELRDRLWSVQHEAQMHEPFEGQEDG